MKHLILIVPLLFCICCTNVNKKKRVDNLHYEKAFSYLIADKSDSAFYYFNKAKDAFILQQDSVGVAKCLVNMGIIATKKNDYFGAQEISLSALDYLDTKKRENYSILSSNYNNLGFATHNLEEYGSAIDFFNSGLKYAKTTNEICIILNNKAKSHEVLKQYSAALDMYDLVLKRIGNDEINFARTLTNISYTKSLQDPTYNPVPSYLISLRIRQKKKDLWGQNSSYSHLSDYYVSKKNDSALFYANKMYEIANRLNSPYDQVESLAKLIKLGPEYKSKGYFDIYLKLNDSLQVSRQTAKNQFALIRYETEKHKSDFLRSQAENIQKQNDILRKNIAVGILVISLLIGFWWYRKRQKSLRQEKEIEVKNTEIKYVKTIHDRVANKVYQVMSEVENTPDLDRDLVLDKLEVLYHISRDISYDIHELNIKENYAAQLHKLVKSYESNMVGITTVGNEDELWERVSDAAKFEVYYIIQELLTNMAKHSHADSVVLKFQISGANINISYLDNGVGMANASKKNGLSNTENRIKLVRGRITFDSTQENEFRIELVFPFL